MKENKKNNATNHLVRREKKQILWMSFKKRRKQNLYLYTDLQQLCADTGCSLEDRLEVMEDRDG